MMFWELSLMSYKVHDLVKITVKEKVFREWLRKILLMSCDQRAMVKSMFETA
jgi:hypothetical protein